MFRRRSADGDGMTVEEQPVVASAPWWRRFHRHRSLPYLVVVVVGALAALASMSMTSRVEGKVGPGTVSVGARVTGEGVTGVALPPLGQVSASTHGAPLRLDVRVDAVDVEDIQRALGRPSPQIAIESEVREDLAPLLRDFLVRTLAGAVVVGGVAGIVVTRRHWAYGLAGAGGGVLAVTGLLAATWVSFDVSAFERARFTGALEHAPTIMATVRDHVEGLDVIEDRVRVVSQQVAGLYAATEADADTAQTLILHVSDIHSNPLGVELTKRLAESFSVDAVLDTGDLTSFGSPVESRIIDLIGDLGVPYLLVPGNHDSPENRQTFREAPAITVLDEDVVEVDDVRILGVADPTYTAEGAMDTQTANRLKLDEAPEVARQVRAEEPDLLAVHDLRQAAEVEGGEVATVVGGHAHERSEERRDGTLLLTVGSTGATGLGTFTVESDQGYEAQVLRYSGDRLVAVDYVTLGGVSGSFEIDRRVVTSADRAVPTEPETAAGRSVEEVRLLGDDAVEQRLEAEPAGE